MVLQTEDQDTYVKIQDVLVSALILALPRGHLWPVRAQLNPPLAAGAAEGAPLPTLPITESGAYLPITSGGWILRKERDLASWQTLQKTHRSLLHFLVLADCVKTQDLRLQGIFQSKETTC